MRDMKGILTSNNNKVSIICFIFHVLYAELRKRRLHTVNMFVEIQKDTAEYLPVSRGGTAGTTSDQGVSVIHVL